MTTEHNLKCHPRQFDEIQAGFKTFEYRKNDRDYKVGDVLRLVKFDPERQEYMPAVLRRKVTSILHGPSFGVPEGYCVMSLSSVL